jgi:hypothetical protein
VSNLDLRGLAGRQTGPSVFPGGFGVGQIAQPLRVVFALTTFRGGGGIAGELGADWLEGFESASEPLSSLMSPSSGVISHACVCYA